MCWGWVVGEVARGWCVKRVVCEEGGIHTSKTWPNCLNDLQTRPTPHAYQIGNVHLLKALGKRWMPTILLQPPCGLFCAVYVHFIDAGPLCGAILGHACQHFGPLRTVYGEICLAMCSGDLHKLQIGAQRTCFIAAHVAEGRRAGGHEGMLVVRHVL